jgi:hypothetical protein
VNAPCLELVLFAGLKYSELLVYLIYRLTPRAHVCVCALAFGIERACGKAYTCVCVCACVCLDVCVNV